MQIEKKKAVVMPAAICMLLPHLKHACPGEGDAISTKITGSQATAITHIID